MVESFKLCTIFLSTLLVSVDKCQFMQASLLSKKKKLVQHHSLISAIEDLPSTLQYVIIITHFSKKKRKGKNYIYKTVSIVDKRQYFYV